MSRRFDFTTMRLLLTWLGVIWLLLATGVAVYDLGGVLPYTQWWLIITGLPLAACQLPFAIQDLTANRRALTFLALLTIGLLACQLYRLPLPSWTAWMLSPGVQKVRTDFAIPSQIELGSRSVTLSLAPHLTATAIAGWSVGILACFIATFSLSTRQTIVAWLIGFALIAASLSFYGIATSLDRQLLPTGYRTTDLAPGGQPFGTFVNRNNAAGVLCIGVCAVLGLGILQIRSIGRSVSRGIWYPGADSRFSWISRYASDPGMLALAALLGLITAGTIVSGSRGGFLTVVITCLATSMRFSGTKKWVPIGGVIGLGILTMVLIQWLGLQNHAVTRFESLLESSTAVGDSPNSRVQHWLDGLRASAYYMLLGSGLGTYRYAYLPVQQYSFGAWYVNADNLWLELLVETGFPGAIVVTLLLGMLFNTARDVSPSRFTFRSLLGALGFSLAIALICSQFFDFGLLLPAMMVPAAAIAMAAVSWSTRAQGDEEAAAARMLGGEVRNYGPRLKSSRGKSVRKARMLMRSPHLFPTMVRTSKTLASVGEFWSKFQIRRLVMRYWQAFRRRPAVRHLFRVQWSLPIAISVSVLILAQSLWSLRTLYDASVVMTIDRQLAGWDFGQIASRKVLDELEREVPQQLARSPHHPELLRLSSEVMLLAFRADLTKQLLSLYPEITPQQAWERSSLSNLRTYLTRDPNSNIQDLASAEQMVLLKTARGHLIAALDQNPLDDLLRFRLLQTDFLNVADREPLVQQYLRIRPRDAVSLWKLATLVSPEGNGKVVAPVVRQLLSEHPDRLSSVIQWLGEDRRLLSTSELEDWIPSSRPDLLVEAIRLRKADLAPDHLEKAYTTAKEWLEQNQVLPMTVRRFTSARLAMLEENWQSAMDLWKEAVQLQPQRIDWKLEQLRCVVETGQPRLALEMAREYVSQHPREPMLQKQLDELQESIVQ